MRDVDKAGIKSISKNAFRHAADMTVEQVAKLAVRQVVESMVQEADVGRRTGPQEGS